MKRKYKELMFIYKLQKSYEMRPYSILELKFINLAICTVCTQNQVFFTNTLYYLPTSCICWPKYLKYF